MKPKQPRNQQARALRSRAGNANVAIAVDTRPKQIKPKKGRGSYQRSRCKLSNETTVNKSDSPNLIPGLNGRIH